MFLKIAYADLVEKNVFRGKKNTFKIINKPIVSFKGLIRNPTGI